MREMHYTVDVDELNLTFSLKTIVKATTVVCATVLVLKVGAELAKPKIKKFNNAVKTEIEKWNPPIKD